MSGVTGALRVKNRADFKKFIESYSKVIETFPNVVNLRPSGSYISDPEKQDFGDIDLIVLMDSKQNKSVIKKEMQSFFAKMPDTVIVPFTSTKHAGKKTYNAGELVTVRYHDSTLGYSVQIDNIVALSEEEAAFKQQFLNMPAEKQGLILGLVKIATLETLPELLFSNLKITNFSTVLPNQEYEFNLSSAELQLRKVTYKPDTFEQVSRDILWRSQNFDDVSKLLHQYHLENDFKDLLTDCKRIIKNPRSNIRIRGIFESMVSVKSGEIGTPKGINKTQSINMVKELIV